MALDVRGLTPLLQVYDMPTSVRFYREVLWLSGGEHITRVWPGSLSLGYAPAR